MMSMYVYIRCNSIGLSKVYQNSILEESSTSEKSKRGDRRADG